MSEIPVYGLRPAEQNDAKFLFTVSTKAMKPVDEAFNPNRIFNEEAEFEKYKKKFVPEEIEIITYGKHDVGRLRVVRNHNNIYVGGIQILPEFQGKGIGTALFLDLKEESNKMGIPITLEVHDVNKNALKFYESLGFTKVGHEGTKTLMQYRAI